MELEMKEFFLEIYILYFVIGYGNFKIIEIFMSFIGILEKG